VKAIHPAKYESGAKSGEAATGDSCRTLFVSTLDTVCKALEVSGTNKARLHSEHDTYRVHCMALQMSKLKNDGALLQTVRDLRVALQPLDFIRDVPLDFPTP